MQIFTMMTYLGTEGYTPKREGAEPILLHKFMNEANEIEKLRRDDFQCEVGRKCGVTYLKGRSRKTGEMYCFITDISPMPEK